MKKFVLFLLSTTFLFTGYTQTGSLDPAFGTNGIRLYQLVPDISNAVLKVIPAPGNYQYVIYSTDLWGYQAITIAKYSGDGTLQTGFGTAGYSEAVAMQFADAALQEDGKLIVAGSTEGSYYGDFHDDLLVARFTDGGALDASFNGSGLFIKSYTNFSYEFTQSVSIGGNRLAVQGYSISLVGGFAFYHVDVFDMNGANTASVILGNMIDDLQLFYPADYNYSVAFQGEKLLAAATVPDFSGNGNYFSLQRFLASGSPDPGFGTGGATTLGNAFFNGPVIVAAQGEKIVVSSYNYNAATGLYGFAVGRYTIDGLFDNSFNVNGMQTIDWGMSTPAMPRAITHRGDELYVGGDQYNAQTNQMEVAIARFKNDGSPDTNFDGDGKQLTGINNYSFSLKNMSVSGARLAVSGLAISATSGRSAALAMYRLESNTLLLTGPADTTVNTDSGLCTAIVNGITAKINGVDNTTNISYTLTGATTGAGSGTVSSMAFNKGLTLVTYTLLTDTSKHAGFRVTVQDNQPPVISAVTASPDLLWPPNHQMVNVQLKYQATDNCSPFTTILSITSNEAQTNTVRGDLPNDWILTDAHHIQLRAERAGKGQGRIYTIRVLVTDASGNRDTAEVRVRVPKSDGGPRRFDDEENEPLALIVYPNPSSNYFTLQTSGSSTEKLSLRVTNQLGMVVETMTQLPANGILRVGQYYPAGLYMAELLQGNERVVTRLVKLP